MKIIDIEIEKTYDDRLSLRIIGHTKSYIITEFSEDFQLSADPSTFIYFTRLDFDKNRITFNNGPKLIGFIDCEFSNPNIKNILIDNLDKFNKESNK